MVDHPASIEALPLAVGRDMGRPVAYPPGLTIRQIAELEMIVGFDDDLAGEATRVANWLHGLLTQIHPSLEQVLGTRLQYPAVLTLLERFGSPSAPLRRCLGHASSGERRDTGLGRSNVSAPGAHAAGAVDGVGYRLHNCCYDYN